MILASPSAEDPPSRLVDWLELLALQRPGDWLGFAEIDRIIRLQEDGRARRRTFDVETQENLEQEILEEAPRGILRQVADELSRRIETMGSAYPFDAKRSASQLSPSISIKLVDETQLSSAQIAYLFSLIISCIRWSIVEIEASDQIAMADEKSAFSEYRYGQLLQICATVALGGYLKGTVYSFGYPRPDGLSFLDAHKVVWDDFGSYIPVENVPIGAPDEENDAGIDLIGWMNFRDSLGSKILVFGQVASGRNWGGKSVMDRAESLRSWFGGPSYGWYVPVMVMPFNISDARKTINSEGAKDLRKSVLEIEERGFGVVIDRDRIATCVEAAFALSDVQQQKIQGMQNFPSVLAWLQLVIARLRG